MLQKGEVKIIHKILKDRLSTRTIALKLGIAINTVILNLKLIFYHQYTKSTHIEYFLPLKSLILLILLIHLL